MPSSNAKTAVSNAETTVSEAETAVSASEVAVSASKIAVSDPEPAVSASKTAVSDAETAVFRTFVPVKGALRNKPLVSETCSGDGKRHWVLGLTLGTGTGPL